MLADILFAEQIDSQQWDQGKICQNAGKGPQGWECVPPTKYENGIFITSPGGITREHIAKVKNTVNGSSVVAYWDFGDMPLNPGPEECPFCGDWIMGTRPGRNCSTTYQCGPSAFLTALRALPGINKLVMHNITEGQSPPTMIESYPGLASYIWNAKLAPLMANFFAKWLKDNGFDGLYLDGYVEPDKRRFAIPDGQSWDMDGDGVADSADTMAGSYFAWAPAFVGSLRAQLGKDVIILANSAGSVSDPSLSGITIEMESCTGAAGVPHCANALDGQHLSTTSAEISPHSVLWLTHSNAMPPAEQCREVAKLQAMYPWTQAGTDFFDGSHVVC